MSISVVNPTVPVIAATNVAPDLVLQAGAVVDAQVLQVLSADLVRIAISNLPIDVLTEVPLVAGQALQLTVSQTPQGVRLAIANPGASAAGDTVPLANGAPVGATNSPANAAPSGPQLTPPEQVAVLAAAETAVTQQGSLAPLFANLDAIVVANGLPPQLRQAIQQVLAQQTSLDQNLTGADIKNGFQKSGIFLEASLASGSVSPAPASSTTGVPDLKAALIVLRQTLLASLNAGVSSEGAGAALPAIAAQSQQPASAQVSGSLQQPVSAEEHPANAAAAPQTIVAPDLAPSSSPEIEVHEILLPQARLPVADDLSEPNVGTARIVLSPIPLNAGSRAATAGAVLNLLQEVALQAIPQAGKTSLPATPLQSGRSDVTIHTNTPPPPIRGALLASQPIASPLIVPEAPLATSVRHLLNDTEAAIARQTLLQVASLPHAVDPTTGRLDPAALRWNFEIPFVTPQGTAVTQFEIARDGGGSEAEAATRVWRARFSIDVEPAGPVHAVVSLSGERTSVRLWAERPATAAQLRAGASQLSSALSKAELQPGDIVIRDGTPPQSAPARAGHFLDRAL
jgi:hypothetical protein